MCGLITARAEGIRDSERISLTAVLLLGPCFCLPPPGLITVTAIGRLSCVELL